MKVLKNLLQCLPVGLVRIVRVSYHGPHCVGDVRPGLIGDSHQTPHIFAEQHILDTSLTIHGPEIGRKHGIHEIRSVLSDSEWML